MFIFITFCIVIFAIFFTLRRISNETIKMHDKLEEELLEKYRDRHNKKEEKREQKRQNKIQKDKQEALERNE